MDGDNYNGFDKFNLQFGIGGIVVINWQLEIGIELFYYNKGVCMELDFCCFFNIKDCLVDFFYVEVFIYFCYNWWEIFFIVYFEGGGVFVWLIDVKIDELVVV